ncbi:hypothetical protein [Plasmodium yoelii yoelii]|uniref:Uncharacterized protein n=1 Tax=Plasmodium yoelii yoelii TaxID=73239 RepID=Q7RKE9_PLAYO|nr:hypothetical protein [Plasmodium yoelii yoelii]
MLNHNKNYIQPGCLFSNILVCGRTNVIKAKKIKKIKKKNKNKKNKSHE